jgi:transcriptional regulator with XRE-family HTH domain
MASEQNVTKLRRWRQNAGFSLDEVADLVGIEASGWSRVERGERPLRPATKVAVARRLGVKVRELWDLEPIADIGADAVANG